MNIFDATFPHRYNMDCAHIVSKRRQIDHFMVKID